MLHLFLVDVLYLSGVCWNRICSGWPGEAPPADTNTSLGAAEPSPGWPVDHPAALLEKKHFIFIVCEQQQQVYSTKKEEEVKYLITVFFALILFRVLRLCYIFLLFWERLPVGNDTHHIWQNLWHQKDKYWSFPYSLSCTARSLNTSIPPVFPSSSPCSAPLCKAAQTPPSWQGCKCPNSPRLFCPGSVRCSSELAWE